MLFGTPRLTLDDVLMIVLAFFLVLMTHGTTLAAEQPQVAVATPELSGPYAGSVILVAPYGEDLHVGVILNRATGATLGGLFPQHEPSKRVNAPVYMGGPEGRDAIFALVRGERVHERDLELGPGLWLVVDAGAVDKVIEEQGSAARYFVGFVGWTPGELDKEVAAGYFVLRRLEPERVLGDPSNLWNELAPSEKQKGQVGT